MEHIDRDFTRIVTIHNLEPGYPNSPLIQSDEPTEDYEPQRDTRSEPYSLTRDQMESTNLTMDI